MKYIIITTLALLIGTKVMAMEEVLLDIVNGIWAAERYNEICPNNPIDLPATEQEITASLIEGTGQDFIGELAKTPFHEEMTLREHAKALVDGYLNNGCETDSAMKKREDILQDLSQYGKIFVQQ
jgi:hypothetical protein